MYFEQRLDPELRTALATMPPVGDLTADVARARAAIAEMKERVTLVLHDWGSALGFDWAFRHSDAVRGIAYMEAITRPRKWGEMHEAIRPAFQALRSPTGEQMVLEDNFFVEVILPKGVLHPLTEEEMAQYRRPFAEPGEARRPTLSWPRQCRKDHNLASSDV